MTFKSGEPLASTERLILRGFVPEDFEAYSAYRSLPVVYRFLYSDPPSALAMRERFDAGLNTRLSEDGDILRCAVVRREDDALLGQVSLKLTGKAALQAELGYIFNPAYAGNGYATEAAQAIITLGFDKFAFHRIFARLDAKNAGSIGVVERTTRVDLTLLHAGERHAQHTQTGLVARLERGLHVLREAVLERHGRSQWASRVVDALWWGLASCASGGV